MTIGKTERLYYVVSAGGFSLRTHTTIACNKCKINIGIAPSRFQKSSKKKKKRDYIAVDGCATVSEEKSKRIWYIYYTIELFNECICTRNDKRFRTEYYYYSRVFSSFYSTISNPEINKKRTLKVTGFFYLSGKKTTRRTCRKITSPKVYRLNQKCHNKGPVTVSIGSRFLVEKFFRRKKKTRHSETFLATQNVLKTFLRHT